MKEALSEKITKSLIEERWFVYKHTSPEGKVYIGITKKLPRERWGRGEGYKDNADFYSDIQSFGWDAFTHEIIDRGLTEQQALDEEDKLIREINCLRPIGYNHRHNRAGKGTEADLSDVAEYAAAKEKILKNHIYRFYKEYMLLLDPSFTPLKYLEKKVPLPKPANREVHRYFPKWLEEVCAENKQEIESINEEMERYKKWLKEFYEKNKENITMAGDGCFGTIFHVSNKAYYDEMLRQITENFKGNKIATDFIFTILKRVKEKGFFDQMIEVEVDSKIYKEIEKSYAWEAKIKTHAMPILRENLVGEKSFLADLSYKNIYISVFEEEIFLSEKSRITFCRKEYMALPILEILESLGAEEISYRIDSFSVVDKDQYDSKSKDKIHYRLQRILKKTKQNNLQQYNFMKKKMNIYYNLHDMKLSDLEEKLYRVENICSFKQEKFISFLVAQLGLKIKNTAFFTQIDAQFLIPNLQKGNVEVIEKYMDRFITI